MSKPFHKCGTVEVVKKLLPPPQGEVAEQSEVGGGVVGFLLEL